MPQRDCQPSVGPCVGFSGFPARISLGPALLFETCLVEHLLEIADVPFSEAPHKLEEFKPQVIVTTLGCASNMSALEMSHVAWAHKEVCRSTLPDFRGCQSGEAHTRTTQSAKCPTQSLHAIYFRRRSKRGQKQSSVRELMTLRFENASQCGKIARDFWYLFSCARNDRECQHWPDNHVAFDPFPLAPAQVCLLIFCPHKVKEHILWGCCNFQAWTCALLIQRSTQERSQSSFGLPIS